jgi:hypothetical protein
MICGVLKAGLYFAGQTLAVLVVLAGLGWPLLAYSEPPWTLGRFLAQYGMLSLALLAGVVVYELGHLLACRAVGAEVKAFRLGGRRAWIRFRAGTVQVSLGWPYRGRVEYGGAPSVWRRAAITLAGSLADLALAGLVLASSAAVASGHGTPPLVVTAADGLAMTGLVNLMPFRTRSGELTDGARLFELRSGVAASRLLAAAQAAARLLRAGRATQLLELHAGLDVPDGPLSVAQAASLAMVEFYVALLPGPLPGEAAQLAERRISALARQQDLGPAAPLAYLTLALLRIRQGDAQGHAEAERLCQRALAVKDAGDPVRRMAFAAVIMSRQARGLPHADVCTTAASTLAPAARSPEAMAAELSAVFDPEAALRAFRRGDPGARLGAGSIAGLLRRQGRTGELLELHAGFGRPAGPHASEQARSLECVEYNVLLEPGLPPEVLDEAASRVQWIAANYPHEQQENPKLHAALEHTLAMARLRQGRFGEVEPLCAPSMAADVGPDNRATVLATIALARRALGQPHADLLAEAVALSPDADLVAEAQSESAATVRDDLRRLPASRSRLSRGRPLGRA